MSTQEGNHVASTPPYTAITGKLVAHDPSVYEEISAPWELIATPLGRGSFGYSKTYLITPAVVAYQEGFDSAVRVRGLTPAGMLGFSIPIRTGSRTAYWNGPLHEKGLPASMPGALDAVIEAQQSHIIVLVNITVLHQVLPAETAAALMRAATQRLLPVPPSVTASLGRWLLQILDEVQRQPAMLQHPAMVRAFEEDLFRRLTELVSLLNTEARRPDITRRRSGFERALEYMREKDMSSLSIPQLSTIAGVGQRTLEYAFRETFNLTPLGFLRLKRFHGARRMLLSTRQGEATVADIAHRNGFYELGRFATSYKRLFGELPSQTMALPPVETTNNPFMTFR
ncbi:MAG: helix-turn-helix domain-containing protein [Pseudomonadota bacterium]|nr:helix-turn-helix domain-containing protein [Pseudomonadota bacterium]